MSDSVPEWFAADQLHHDRGGWYIGSGRGFRVGPYPRRADAERHSRGLVADLARCSTTTERVRVVRAFIRRQNVENGRRVHTAPAATAPVVGRVDVPPVRAGEAPRVWFRTSRFFAVGDVWFFATREDVDVGPYASRAEAERDAWRLLEILRETGSLAESRLAIRQFKARPQLEC